MDSPSEASVAQEWWQCPCGEGPGHFRLAQSPGNPWRVSAPQSVEHSTCLRGSELEPGQPESGHAGLGPGTKSMTVLSHTHTHSQSVSLTCSWYRPPSCPCWTQYSCVGLGFPRGEQVTALRSQTAVLGAHTTREVIVQMSLMWAGGGTQPVGSGPPTSLGRGWSSREPAASCGSASKEREREQRHFLELRSRRGKSPVIPLRAPGGLDFPFSSFLPVRSW